VPNYSDTAEQTEKTHGTEDVEDVEDAEEAPSARQDYVWTYRKRKQGDRPYLNKSNQLFHKTLGNVNPEEEPTPTESKAEQRPSTKQHFFNNLLGNNSPTTASSMIKDVAEEDGSSLGGHLPAVPPTPETHRKQQTEGSSFLDKPGSSNSPDGPPVQGDLFETKVNRHLCLLVPDEALRMFIAHVARALRTDCSRPELHLTCAKMVSKTGLLVKLFSERQEEQGASALLARCLLEGNVSNSMALAGEAGKKSTGKWKPEYTLGDGFLLAILVSVIIVIILTAICLAEV
ncbi:L37A2 protein, partial [Pluvianellus socialis]|nr:L37A2 protein [Pluvianellus socialis]